MPVRKIARYNSEKNNSASDGPKPNVHGLSNRRRLIVIDYVGRPASTCSARRSFPCSFVLVLKNDLDGLVQG